MRALLIAAVVLTTATASYAAEAPQTEPSLWQRIVAWFQPAQPAQLADDSNATALAESIPPAPAGAQNVGQALAGNAMPSMPRDSAFSDPLMSIEDLSAIAPAAGAATGKDLSQGFEDPQPSISAPVTAQ